MIDWYLEFVETGPHWWRALKLMITVCTITVVIGLCIAAVMAALGPGLAIMGLTAAIIYLMCWSVTGI